MRECWVVFDMKIPEGHSEPFVATWTGDGDIRGGQRPPIDGDIWHTDLGFEDMILHVYYSERIGFEQAVSLSRIAHHNGDLGKDSLVKKGGQ